MFFKRSVLFTLIGIYSSLTGFSQALSSPVFDSVTVNSAGRAFLTWQVSPDPTATGYFIYEYINNQNLNPVNIPGRLTNTYTFPTNKASTTSQSFTIAAYSATDTSLINEDFHRTLYLTSVFDTCQAAVQLNWNTYMNWPDNVKQYEVIVEDGSSATVVYTGPNTSYVHTGLLSGISYRYTVRAVSGNGTKTSTSNADTVTGNFKKAPDSLYIAAATVPASGSVLLRWISDSASTAGGITYKIELSTDNVNFSEVQQVNLPYQRTNSLTVTGLNTTSEVYYFRIIAETQCPDRSVQSVNVANTMLITADQPSEAVNQLSWNAYQQWEQGVGMYEIYRTIAGTTTLIATNPGTVTTYTDSDPIVQSTEETICYYVKAIESGLNSYGVQESSLSDVICVTKEAKIFVPDAFTPGGNHPVFKPLILSGAAETYRLLIYSRYGNLLFSVGQDPEKGWDGLMKDGNDAPAGVYIYHITITGKDGRPYQKTGTVALIR